MRYVLQVTAYDVMDQVQISLVLHEWPPVATESRTLAIARTGTVRGTGESDPAQWAIDALVAALELL
jgi:hypothetical protein